MANWLWPVPGQSKITSGVGPRWGSTHKGIDIAAPAGTAVIASRAGKVVNVNNKCTHWNTYPHVFQQCSSFGNYVVIDHYDGIYTIYAHLTQNRILVSNGSTVTAGQVIGYSGSSGASTGPHLHFEMRKGTSWYQNVTTLDPEKYVSFDNTIVPPATADVTDIASSSTTYEGGSVPYNPDYVEATMSSQFVKDRLMYAYLDIYLGDNRLSYTHGKPSIIMNFSMNRISDYGSKAQFVLFDDNWDEIEGYLAVNWEDVRIQYGYANSNIISPLYVMRLEKYSLEFRETGVILSISAISNGTYENLKVVDTFDTGTKNPTEAIRAICNQLGWKVDESNFVETQTIYDRTENYMLNLDNPATYIQNVIVKEARTFNDEIVKFQLASDADNTASLVVSSYGQAHNDNSEVKTYIYRKGYDSVVEDLSFDIKGVFGGTTNFYIATGLEGETIGTLDKKPYASRADQQSVLTESTGIYSHTMLDQSIPSVNTSGESATQLANKLFYHVKNSTTSQYEATMTIVGDPDIELLDDIRIINITDAGYLHHTSGIYMVKGISDVIENGTYKTTLKLQRNGDINEGLEIRDPRKVIK